MKTPARIKVESNNVCRLKKCIYGLKQAGRVWNKTLDKVMQNMNALPCKSDPCLCKRERKGETDFIAVFEDDLVISCKNEAEKNNS